MKGDLPWLVPWAGRVGTRDFCSTLAALVGSVQNICFLTIHYFKSFPTRVRRSFSLIFALSETLQESENNESETKILSEKLKSLKVIFKYLDSKLVAAQGICSYN
jgi:hypothetical protein